MSRVVSALRFSDTRGDQDWSYTPDGLPLSVTTVNVPGAVHPINQYKYNRRRMLVGETQHLPAWYSYSIAYSFDVGGNLRRLHYPSSDYVDFAPNALGQATRATNADGLHYARDAVYYPNGALQQFTYGNDIVHTMEQNARQLPERVRSMYGSATTLDFTYAYDANSNITSILDGVPRPGSNGHRTMGYDALDRLTHVESATFASAYGGANRMDFGYDALDNLKTWKVSSPGVTSRDDLYCYNGTNRLAQVRNGATSCSNGTLGNNLSYDPNGNVQVKNTQAFDFDYGNRLREVIDVERYRYDAHGRRILAMNFQLGTVTSQYAQSGQLLFQKNPRTGVSKDIDHVYFAGSLVAQREQPIGGGAVTVKYQHTDALGSPVVVTSQTRAELERVDYEPYGKQLGSAASTGSDRPGYTGHVEDRATGLTYMQQRYYDGNSAAFITADPVTAFNSPVMAFHRYKYAANNPYRFTDPDGRREKVTGSNISGNSVAIARMAGTAAVPKTITADMVQSVGTSTGEEARAKNEKEVVADANRAGRVAQLAGDGRAVRAFNKISSIKIDGSDWSVSNYRGETMPDPQAAASVEYDQARGQGMITLNMSRYFSHHEWGRNKILIHEFLHFDADFYRIGVAQQRDGCAAWRCPYEREIEKRTTDIMHKAAGWVD